MIKKLLATMMVLSLTQAPIAADPGTTSAAAEDDILHPYLVNELTGEVTPLDLENKQVYPPLNFPMQRVPSLKKLCAEKWAKMLVELHRRELNEHYKPAIDLPSNLTSCGNYCTTLSLTQLDGDVLDELRLLYPHYLPLQELQKTTNPNLRLSNKYCYLFLDNKNTIKFGALRSQENWNYPLFFREDYTNISFSLTQESNSITICFQNNEKKITQIKVFDLDQRTLQSELILKGCLIQDSFISDDGNYLALFVETSTNTQESLLGCLIYNCATQTIVFQNYIKKPSIDTPTLDLAYALAPKNAEVMFFDLSRNTIKQRSLLPKTTKPSSPDKALINVFEHVQLHFSFEVPRSYFENQSSYRVTRSHANIFYLWTTSTDNTETMRILYYPGTLEEALALIASGENAADDNLISTTLEGLTITEHQDPTPAITE